MKKVALFALFVLLFTSCATTYYQVFSVMPDKSQTTPNGSPVYSQDGLEFTYNFWGEGGKVRFIVYNSNDYDVIVDLTKSSFIRNNIAEDYYQDRQYETRVATGVYRTSKQGASITVEKGASAGTLVNYFGKTYDVALAVGAASSASVEVGSTVKKEWETAVVTSEPKEVRIPAKSAKAFCTFNVNTIRIVSSELYAGMFYHPLKFTKDNSPMEFRNRICVSHDNGEESYYDMCFYIDSIGNIQDIQDQESPTKFYVSYSSKLEGETSKNDVFANNESSRRQTPRVSLSGKASNASQRESAVRKLQQITDNIYRGNIADMEQYKKEVKEIDDWYKSFPTPFVDVEVALKRAKQALKPYMKKK